ncbi:MAG: DUF3185 domain-containing protein [Acidobacteria bacterium]|nr:DUF3185 domain-containing protein [Acidobacteriota bacterium]
MKTSIGIILVGIGLLSIGWTSFSYTTQEKLFDIGPVHATREKTHLVTWPLVGSIAVLAGGAAMLLVGRKA